MLQSGAFRAESKLSWWLTGNSETSQSSHSWYKFSKAVCGFETWWKFKCRLYDLLCLLITDLCGRLLAKNQVMSALSSLRKKWTCSFSILGCMASALTVPGGDTTAGWKNMPPSPPFQREGPSFLHSFQAKGIFLNIWLRRGSSSKQQGWWIRSNFHSSQTFWLTLFQNLPYNLTSLMMPPSH